MWTVAGGGGYAGEPRPAVIVQSDEFGDTASLTICGFTRDETEAPLFRPLVDPNAATGLRQPCRLMVDKLMTVPKMKLGARIGVLADHDVVRLNQALIVFLGLATSPKAASVADDH